MIHIATVHWRSDRWIDIQLRYLERNLDEPYRVYAWLDEEMRAQAHKFFYATDVPVERHELKLTLLGDLVAHAADPDESDHLHRRRRLPVAPIMPFLRVEARALPPGRGPPRREQRRPPAAPVLLRHDRRVLARAARRLAARAHLDQSRRARRSRTSGGNLLGLLEDAGHRVVPDAAHQQGQPAPAPVRGLRGPRVPPWRRLPPHRRRQVVAGVGRGQAQRDPARPAGRAPPRRGARGPCPEAIDPCAATAGRSARSWRGSTSRSSS